MAAKHLKIVVDENVPYARETFGSLGAIELVHGRKITPAHVREADVLIVRSITRVNEHLLGGSRVRFVGTATIGVDHVDVEYLEANGIAFRSAPGSNANSVSEYIVAALLLASDRTAKPLEGCTIGVVGVGNVGSRGVPKAETLGMRCLLNDPPKQRETGDSKYLPLHTLLRESDFISLHVPLERRGPDATVDLAGTAFFQSLKRGSVFLNSSRGQVVEQAALQAALAEERVRLAVLDVWQNEPKIDPNMVRQSFLATPHIAGYSFDGKVAATGMLYEAVCSWLGQTPTVDWHGLLPPPPVPMIDLTGCRGSEEHILRAAVLRVYDILRDDRDLREAVEAEDERGTRFDLLRKNYPVRREFQNTEVRIPPGCGSVEAKLHGLGFRVRADN